MKSFKKWLIEWEGNNFNQETDLVNGPAFPGSKWKGPSMEPVEKHDYGKKFGFDRKKKIRHKDK